MPAAEVPLTPGEPHRVPDKDCPKCGWADLWEAGIYHLAPTGVTQTGRVVRCVRCHTTYRPGELP